MAAACAPRSPAAELYPHLEEFEGREVVAIRFVGPEPFGGDTLARLVETEPTHANLLGLPIHLFGLGLQRRFLDLAAMHRDVARLTLFYRRSGYFGTQVYPAVEPVDDDEVVAIFLISRGDPVLVERLEIRGVEGILDTVWVRRTIPLQQGGILHLGRFEASADTILRALREQGHMYAEVLRGYDIDARTDRAEVEYEAVPGPVVVVDSIVVVGAPHLGRRTALRHLTFEAGDVLRQSDLVESQRNLYALELVQFATVSVAEDTLQRAPADSTTATVAVRVSEAPVHVVEAAVGFGTVDCFRGETRWVNRNFGGGARRLTLTGSVSKVGIGDPVDLGLDGSICRAFRGDPFEGLLDYRFTADLLQPWFLGPRNRLAVQGYAERQTEPNVFQREARGGRLAVTRVGRLRRSSFTGALEVERGRTLASEAIFCIAFLVCLPEDVEALARPRWTNALAANWLRDRTNRPVDPTRGDVRRVALAWAAPWLGSDVRFVRGTIELAAYRTVRPAWVAAGAIQFGSFFGTASVVEPGRDFLPPDARFYSGGAYSVRGFERNLLGPGVYVATEGEVDPVTGTVLVGADDVTFVPTGGTALAVVNAEVRMPGFIAPDILRMAVFIDAGAVGLEDVRDLGPDEWRVTPGAGVRIQTPVGPVRLDLAYNPYGPRVAPLFLPDPETGALVRVTDRFAPERPGFFGRIRLHLAIGQAF